MVHDPIVYRSTICDSKSHDRKHKSNDSKTSRIHQDKELRTILFCEYALPSEPPPFLRILYHCSPFMGFLLAWEGFGITLVQTLPTAAFRARRLYGVFPIYFGRSDVEFIASVIALPYDEISGSRWFVVNL